MTFFNLGQHLFFIFQMNGDRLPFVRAKNNSFWRMFNDWNVRFVIYFNGSILTFITSLSTTCGAINSRIALFSASDLTFSQANEKGILKQKKKNSQISRLV